MDFTGPLSCVCSVGDVRVLSMQTHPALLYINLCFLAVQNDFWVERWFFCFIFEFMRIISYCSSIMLLVSLLFLAIIKATCFQNDFLVGCPTYQFVKTLIKLDMCSWTFPSLMCVYVPKPFCLHLNLIPVKAGMLLSCLFVCVDCSQWLFKHGVLVLTTNQQVYFQKNANSAWRLVGTIHLVDI